MISQFIGNIKEFGIKSLVSGDAEGQLKVYFRLNKTEFAKLVQLYEADQEVVISISNINES